MKTVPVEMETHTDGDLVEKKTVRFGILPPKPGSCAICGHKHEPALPHNCQSLYYQYAFYGQHGRWPTWADACAHTAPDMREAWERELRRLKHWSEPPAGSDPIAESYKVQE